FILTSKCKLLLREMEQSAVQQNVSKPYPTFDAVRSHSGFPDNSEGLKRHPQSPIFLENAVCFTHADSKVRIDQRNSGNNQVEFSVRPRQCLRFTAHETDVLGIGTGLTTLQCIQIDVNAKRNAIGKSYYKGLTNPAPNIQNPPGFGQRGRQNM